MTKQYRYLLVRYSTKNGIQLDRYAIAVLFRTFKLQGKWWQLLSCHRLRKKKYLRWLSSDYGLRRLPYWQLMRHVFAIKAMGICIGWQLNDEDVQLRPTDVQLTRFGRFWQKAKLLVCRSKCHTLHNCARNLNTCLRLALLLPTSAFLVGYGLVGFHHKFRFVVGGFYMMLCKLCFVAKDAIQVVCAYEGLTTTQRG